MLSRGSTKWARLGRHSTVAAPKYNEMSRQDQCPRVRNPCHPTECIGARAGTPGQATRHVRTWAPDRALRHTSGMARRGDLHAAAGSQRWLPESAARIWAPLARFIETEARIGAWAGQRRATLVALRVRPLRPEAGVGVPVRRAAAGAADRHALFYPKGAGSPATTSCSWPRSRSRPACSPSSSRPGRRPRSSSSSIVVGTAMEIFKTARRLVGLSRGQLLPHRRRAAVLRLHVRRRRLLHRPRLAPVRFPVHAPSAAVVARRAQRRHLRQLLRAPLHGRHPPRPVRIRGAAVRPCTVHYKIWRVHRAMPLLVGLGLVALFIWFAENIGTFSNGLALSEPEGSAGSWCRSTSSAPGSC